MRIATDETRDHWRRRVIPRFYRWWLHVGLNVVIWLGITALCLWQIADPTPRHFLTLAIGLVIANLGEFAIHRWVFHVKGVAPPLYKRHTTIHHSFFSYERMTFESSRDLAVVMLPPWGLLGVHGIIAPFVALFVLTGDPNKGWMLMLAINIYYLFYESSHTLSHLIVDGGRFDNAFCNWVARHHRLHHDPQLMRRYNFAFQIPFFDWLTGSLYRGEVSSARRTPAIPPAAHAPPPTDHPGPEAY